MRTRARLLAAAAVACSAWIPGQALANTGSGSLSVHPDHGQRSAAFTATFSEPGVLGAGCPPATVAFTWDGRDALGSAPLTGPDPAGNCDAGLTAVPPAADNSAGAHTVTGDDGAGNTGDASYTIDRAPSSVPSPVATGIPSPAPAPSQAPRSAVTPAPPQASPPAPPRVAPSGPPQCAVWPQVDLIPESRLAGFDGPAAGVRIAALGPGALLPPRLGRAGYPAAILTLAAAARPGVSFHCVSVTAGPSAGYFYARYVFEQVTVAGVSGSTADATISLRYREVFYDYRALVDGQVGPEVTGHGFYSAAAARPAPAWPLIGSGAVALLAALTGGVLRIRRVTSG